MEFLFLLFLVSDNLYMSLVEDYFRTKGLFEDNKAFFLPDIYKVQIVETLNAWDTF